ncbi:MAG: hypothetical protein WAM85_01125 [Terracidiphilus sp.]
MSDKYTPVPSIVPDRPNENQVRNFLSECCCWKRGEDSDKYPLYEAFKDWAWSKGFSPIDPTYVEAELRAMGHVVGVRYIRGIFLRPTEATVPVAAPKSGYAASEKLPGGSAAVSTPHKLTINPDDPPEVRKQKEAYNAALNPEPPKEIIFTSAKPSM